MLLLSSPPPLRRPQFTAFRYDQPHRSRYGFSASAASSGKRLERLTSTDSSHLCLEEAKKRIRKLLPDVDISVSPYDTAWVAMVPSPHSSKVPLFPKCVDWLLANQLQDGSWTTTHLHPFLLKDALSSSLAAVLAIKRWGIGEQIIDKGIRFIESNFGSITDENQLSPIGFDIIFPGMLEYARDLDLNLQLDSTILDALLRKRHLELKRCQESQFRGSEAYLAYVSEGIVKFQDWDMVMKYQRKNGSLFNSPSTTAAALMHVQNPAFLNYFDSILEKFGCAVPAVYPLDVYAQLCLIDNLERLGLCRHFGDDIQSVLEDTYSLWMQGKEEIFKDISTCALAFRLLRKHGYDVSSDPLGQLSKEECFSNSFGGHFKDMISILELYRAAEMILHQDESTLEKLKLWSEDFMRAKISASDSSTVTGKICKEMDDALKFPCHATLQRITNRRTIEDYNTQNIRVLKSSYCSRNFGNEDLLTLAVEDFNRCQLIHLEELKQLERYKNLNDWCNNVMASLWPIT